MSLRSANADWHKGLRAAAAPIARHRLLVSVAGGMMRETYLLSGALNRDVFVGVVPAAARARERADPGAAPVHRRLKVLDLGGAGSRARPSGLRLCTLARMAATELGHAVVRIRVTRVQQRATQ
jgi:hypothetical protein